MKKILSLVIILTIITSSFSTVFAKQTATKTYTNSDGDIINVTVDKKLPVIPEDVIQEIIDSNPELNNINITGVGFAETTVDIGQSNPNTASLSSDSKEDESLNMVTASSVVIGPIIKTYTSTKKLVKDSFMASCARGETKTVSSTITSSLDLKTSGDVPWGSLELNGKISYSITKGTTLVGPPESSSYNCREFRCKFYENRGYWDQIVIINNVPLHLSGTFNEPNSYYSYSRDLNI